MNFMLHSPDLAPVLLMQETVLQALIGAVRRKGTETEVNYDNTNESNIYGRGGQEGQGGSLLWSRCDVNQVLFSHLIELIARSA